MAAVVIAPTFNNAGTLEDILSRIRTLALPLIVVNDGSTDRTAEILSHLDEVDGVTVINHAQNQGKAAALRSGFRAALEGGFTHAITIDTDAQHDPEQIPLLLEEACQNPDAIVLGTRNSHASGYPARSKLGRLFSNLMVWLQSGARVSDSQCGFRVYPLRAILALTCKAGHYGFETEILTRAAWAGIAIEPVAINCRYLPPRQRVSHFRPWVDSMRALGMHLQLIPQAMRRWPGRLAWWLSPARAWRNLKHHPAARTDLASGLALGVFIACLPAYGIQSLLSLFAAKKFNVHPLFVLAGSQLSMPPLSPLLISASLALGHLLLHGTWPSASDWHTVQHTSLLNASLWRAWLVEWLAGGLLLGAMLGSITYLITSTVFRLAPRLKPVQC